MKKIAKKVGTLSLLGCAMLNGSLAVAEDSGWYGGANLGQSRANIDNARIAAQLRGVGLTSTSIIDNNRDTGFKLYGGYQVNRNFAFEGGYFDLGQFGFTSTTLPLGTLAGNIKLKGLNLDALGILPITDRFSAFGRVGMNYAEARDTFRGTGAVIVLNPTPSKRELNYKFGVGLQYALSPAVGVRAEAERYRINDAVGNRGDIDLISLGLVYRFGVKTPTPVALAPEPQEVAAEPIVVPPPPPPRKVIFAADSSADSLFDFDSSAIKPTGKLAIDKFAEELRGANYAVITVTGHTDRIGSHAYNLKLSTQRAEAVKAYLIESANIPADKISASGVDGAFPLTKPEDCVSPKKAAKKASKELIACLAPDRRVEVEVSATRTAK